MELYRITKEEIKNGRHFAHRAAEITGRPYLLQLADVYKCVMLYGCGPSQYYDGKFYKLRSFERSKTYTKKRSHRMKSAFNQKEYLKICECKTNFNKYFADYVKRKWIYCKEATLEDLVLFIDRTEKIIVKPTNLYKGMGVHELEKSQSSVEIAKDLLGQDTLLEEMIVQHPDMVFGNKSVNTLRITTIMDRNQNVHLLKSALRCGVGSSIVDNYSAGGVTYPVNLDYGIVEGSGVGSKSGSDLYFHPGTDICMLGKTIPFWDEVKSMIV